MQTSTLVESEEFAEAAAELEAIEAELCRRHLYQFIQKIWEVIEPARPFVSNWHIVELCKVLEAVTRGELQRVIINIPPGSMKSLLVSVIWPAWEWASQPGLRYLCASYGAHLSIRDNVRVRQIITSPWYQKHFQKLRLDGDQNAKERFNTTENGWRVATSVGGVGTGEHPDRIIIDDPTSADQARSDAERQAANEWFDRTMSTRVARDPAILIIMQRLHEEDLTGWIQAKKSDQKELTKLSWEHVCFQMRYETQRERDKDKPEHERWKPDHRDPRREVGELFWPELYPEPKVRALEIDLGPYGTAGQLQQRPAPEGGGLFQRSWFQIVDALPIKVRKCRGWDTAASEQDGDYTVGVLMAEAKDGTIYVAHVVRDRLGPDGVDKLMRQTAIMDGKRCMQREEKEGGASGKAVVTARAKTTMKGFDYKAVGTSGDKIVRAKPFRAQCEAGNVKLVRGSWNSAYLDELADFPVGKHDDQIDGSSAAYNALVEEGPKLTSATW